MRTALIQTGWTGDRESMAAVYRELVARAAAEGAELIGLPELTLAPYFPARRDPAGFDWAEPLHDGPTSACFGPLARQHGVTLIASLFERAEDGGLFDTAVVYNPAGELAAATRKIHIPSGEGYHETDFFTGGTEYPVFDLGGLRLAAPTCYDQWFPELARIYTLNGAEFIFYPTAIGSEPTAPDVDTQEAWRAVMRGHAIANGVYIGAANRIGCEGDLTFYGGSFICAPDGTILAAAGRDTTEIIHADLTRAAIADWRTLFPLLHQRRPATYQRLLAAYEGPPPDRWAAESARESS